MLVANDSFLYVPLCHFSTQEFQAAKKESSGLLTKMADSFHNMSASYMMKNRSAEFVVMNEYANTFAEKIGVLDRISQRIVKEQYGKKFELKLTVPLYKVIFTVDFQIYNCAKFKGFVYYRPHMREGNVFILSVCVSVCPFRL